MEEMEITADFGHTGFGEDIDIDVDFAVGQLDEDLELADFDQAQEMQNFNSDTRDELMAEGDDASYGMIDADDLEHNETIAAANDIEIDLGGSDENLWQTEAPQQGTFDNADEIDYSDNTGVSNINTENLGIGDDSWLEASGYATAKPGEVESAQADSGAINTSRVELLQGNTAAPGGVDSQDFGVSETPGDNAEAASISGAATNELRHEEQNALDEQQDVTYKTNPRQPTEDSTTVEKGERVGNKDDRSERAASQGSSAHDSGEQLRHLAAYHEASDTGYGQSDGASEHGHEGPAASVASNYESVGERPIENGEQAEYSLPESGASDHQLGDDSYAEATNDQEYVDQDPEQADFSASNDDDTHSQSNAYIDSRTEDGEPAEATKEEQSSYADKAHVEDPLSIATRHEMVISYGSTDYRLFAKSEDDDPNQYFLSDMTALELPLSQFLSSLRDVIADEVSPLNELVMHVDGLGLKFSESSSSDMLEQFTFGDILGLYDKLVENDGAESAPTLYTYLMVRPNCHQRLMALFDSANSGRGLSEIAIYEASLVDEEEVDDLDSQAPSVPAPGEEDEEAYEYEENDDVDDGADEGEHVGKDDVSDDSNSSPAHTSAAEANIDELAAPAETPKEEPKEDTDKDADKSAPDDLIDYSDDELDLSSSKQGNFYSSTSSLSYFSHKPEKSDCQCDACFERDLDLLYEHWGPFISPSTWSGNGVGTHPVSQSDQHGPSSSNGQLQAASTIGPSVSLPERTSLGGLRMITNFHLLQDQQANASTRDRTHETQKDSDAVVTAIDDDPNQHTTPTNGPIDVSEGSHSNITSATATLNGDDNDEIDYSDDDGEEVTHGSNGPSIHDSGVPTKLQVPIDDEITWESENEEAKNDSISAPKETAQVSPPSAKRPRSDSDTEEVTDQQNDVKRRRS
ncbi:hypothetical protein GGR54DRAFT_637105 [Hypoxylon sp. NC1633]|nr:hypothetical protein GGR54DRAFT_637105 [Hypoxylon sp. NC1633]